jgi:hypothetical protein
MPQPIELGQTPHPELLWAPASAGELLDRLTILALKVERLTRPPAADNVRREHALVHEVCRRAGLLGDARLAHDLEALRDVNQTLWEVEDALRQHEQSQCFDEAFVQLARSVYRLNDRRAGHKRAINDVVGSSLREEKSHELAYADRQADTTGQVP